MTRIYLLSAVCGLASCAAPMEITGRYAAAVTESDVQQIRTLAESRPDIRKPIYRITVEAPSRAMVRSGSERYIAPDTFTEFTVVKARGRWKIASPITRSGTAEVERVIWTQ